MWSEKHAPTREVNLHPVPWCPATFPPTSVTQHTGCLCSDPLKAGVADIYSSTARSKPGSNSSGSSLWDQKYPKAHTEQMKSVHLPHGLLELNSSVRMKGGIVG